MFEDTPNVGQDVKNVDHDLLIKNIVGIKAATEKKYVYVNVI